MQRAGEGGGQGQAEEGVTFRPLPRCPQAIVSSSSPHLCDFSQANNVLLSSCPEDPRGVSAKLSDFGLSFQVWGDVPGMGGCWKVDGMRGGCPGGWLKGGGVFQVVVERGGRYFR